MDPLAVSAIIMAVFAGLASLLALIKNSKCCGMEINTREQPLQNDQNLAIPITSLTPPTTPQQQRKIDSNV